jgi:hypothetical protein
LIQTLVTTGSFPSTSSATTTTALLKVPLWAVLTPLMSVCISTSTVKAADVYSSVAIVVDAFMEMIRFFTTLILNADEAEL